MREDGLDQIARGVAHVLAIVDDQQADSAVERRGHRLAHALAGLLGDAQDCGHRVGNRCRVADRSEFEKPDTVREFIGQAGRDFGGQTGFADAAHPGQRDEPVRFQLCCHRVEFRLASDETAGRGPQISGRGVEGPQRRKVGTQAGRADLEDPDCGRQVAQAPGPQIQQIDSGEQTRRRIGQQDLTTMAGCHDSGGPVQDGPEVVGSPEFGFAGCQPHPYR